MPKILLRVGFFNIEGMMMFKKPGWFAYMFIFTLSFIISSCSKDDDEFSLIGKWNIDGGVDIIKENGEVVHHNTYQNSGTVTFNDDGSGLFKEPDGFLDTFNWSLIDDELFWTWIGGTDDGFTTVYNLKIISTRKIELENIEIWGEREYTTIIELSKV